MSSKTQCENEKLQPVNAELIKECIDLGNQFAGIRVEGETIEEKKHFLHHLFSKSRDKKKQA
ncbi:hypothetical protein VCHA53O466_40224 [Vibrio chagasii]|nr:hypothetical protein VCHA53O466_40224 [Vibrio chagasii]